MSDNWLAEVLHDTMNDESIEGLRARLAASEVREAAMRRALEQRPLCGGRTTPEWDLLAEKATCLAQPSAAPSVPREEPTMAELEKAATEVIREGVANMEADYEALRTEHERVKAERDALEKLDSLSNEAIAALGGDTARQRLQDCRDVLDTYIVQVVDLRDQLATAQKERDTARDTMRAANRGAETNAHALRLSSERNVKLIARITELEAALRHISSGEIEPANVPEIAAATLAATAPDAQSGATPPTLPHNPHNESLGIR